MGQVPLESVHTGLSFIAMGITICYSNINPRDYFNYSILSPHKDALLQLATVRLLATASTMSTNLNVERILPG
jgi:hypothetical protein